MNEQPDVLKQVELVIKELWAMRTMLSEISKLRIASKASLNGSEILPVPHPTSSMTRHSDANERMVRS
jgi:hypothetical protein